MCASWLPGSQAGDLLIDQDSLGSKIWRAIFSLDVNIDVDDPNPVKNDLMTKIKKSQPASDKSEPETEDWLIENFFLFPLIF